MGCAPSCGPSIGVTEDDIDAFAPPSPIPVSIGSGIRKLTSEKSVIFIFGGPGSQKGMVMEELSAKFGFVSITVEELIFRFLPNKLANTVEYASEVMQMLKNDAGVLSLDWILSMISAKIATSVYERFVVDIVPELSCAMRSECFTASSHDRMLENFERKHPVMFALELSVFDESLLTETVKDAPKGPQLSKELNSFMQGMDDIDKGRLQKRVEAYHKCAQPFLKYFSSSKRVVRLTLKGQVPNAVSTVRDIIKDFGFTLQTNPQRVILFSLKEHFFNDIDLDYYKMRKIRLSDIIKGKQDDMISQLLAVQQYIERTGSHDENFAVVLDGLNVPDKKPSRRTLFYDRTQTYLDDFLTYKSSSKIPFSRERIQVQMVATPGEHTLLFLDPFSDKAARTIGLIYAADSSAATTSPSPESQQEELDNS